MNKGNGFGLDEQSSTKFNSGQGSMKSQVFKKIDVKNKKHCQNNNLKKQLNSIVALKFKFH